jgi:two-component system response regulator FixJ
LIERNAAAAGRTYPATMSADPVHIAIVENDAAVLSSLEFMFGVAGYRVSAYRLAEDACASVEIAEADCLIVDFALPDLDGLSLVRRLRSRGVAAPAILISSLPCAQGHAAATEAGIAMIEKPLNSDTLDRWVRQVAER